MNRSSLLTMALTMTFVLLGSMVVTACSSSGSGNYRTHVNYGVGYRGYHRRPWGYPPVYIGGGGGGIGEVDPDWGVDAPVAVPMPSMGMPDMGGMDMGGMDFDW